MRANGFGLGEVFCFTAPALQFVQFQMIGILQATDLMCLVALPIAVLRHPDRLRQKPVPAMLTLGTLWLLAQIATDLLRQSRPEDYLRGWSKILLILASFTLAWTVVCRSRRRFILYGVGTGIGGLLTLYLTPSDQMIDSPWKFGAAMPITLLVVIGVACYASSYLGILVPLTVLAVAHSFANTRSLAILCVLTAVYCLYQKSIAGEIRRMERGRLLFLGALVTACVFSFTAVYSYYAERGVFGEYAQRKLAAQTGEGGLLLGGRGEVLASGKAILDSPLLGHGSWAQDPTYAAILAQERRELGYKVFQSGKKDYWIPSHSHIFGAWVESGLAGAVFWIYVLIYVVGSLMNVSGWEPLLPLFAFAGLMLAWDIPFSPISPDRRFVTPYLIAAMILLRLLRSPQTYFSEAT
jgi:hypothetical protein